MPEALLFSLGFKEMYRGYGGLYQNIEPLDLELSSKSEKRRIQQRDEGRRISVSA